MPPDDSSHSLNSSDNTRASNETERRAWLERQRSLAPETGRLTPGQVLAGRFTIVRFLARGGMGEVYEARDSFLKGDRVALKTIGLGDPASGLEDRFEKEVLLARQVVHPNVCPIYDLFLCDADEGCLCFLTMKLLREESLAQRLGRMRVPAEEAQQITRQVALGLRAAHEVGVIHRDLKPGNIMVEGAGAQVKAVITDFGLAREHEAELTLLSGAHIPGTPGYIAPELLGGQQATPASDLYAFGVLLHELFTGQRPIPLASLDKKIPSIYGRLIEACLDADSRVRSQGFERALAVWEPRPGRRPATYSSPPRWTRRKLLGTSAAALGCAAAGALWWERDNVEDLFHPLPRKRFVALLPPPADADGRTRPMLAGALEAIEDDLSRAEASDHDLFVISRSDVSAAGAASNQLHAVRDALGANLVLQASALTGSAGFDLLLRLLDSSSGALLREKRVKDALGEIKFVANRAVEAAARLLDVHLNPKSFKAREAETGNPAAYEAFHAAEDLMKRGTSADITAAVEKYKLATEADPRYALAYAKLAVAYCFLQSLRSDPAFLDLARANCQTALELQKDLVEAYQALSFVYEHTGDQTRALEEIGRALTLDPENPRTLAWKARIFRHWNRWRESEQTYRQILKLRPNYWPAYNDIGLIENSEGRYQKAIESFRIAVAAAPGSALAFNNLGALYLKLGDFQNASDCFKKSLARDPNELAYANTATALRAEGKYTQAIEYARKAIATNEADDQNWLELGDCLFSSAGGKNQGGLEAYKNAASLAERHVHTDPADGPAWMLLALYRAKIRSQDPLALVRKAEALGAFDLDSQLAKARVFELLGKRQEAIRTLADCLRRGMTTHEVVFIPEFRALRKDPAYLQVSSLAAVH